MLGSDLMPRPAVTPENAIDAQLASIGGVRWDARIGERSAECWLTALLTMPAILRASVDRIQESHSATTVITGVEAIRDEHGEIVAIVATRDLLDAEHLRLMCDGARLDFETTHAALMSMGLMGSDEIRRLSGLLGGAIASPAAPATVTKAAPLPDHMAVMQSLIGRMRHVDQPGPFLEHACAELHAAMEHDAIVLYIADDQARLGSVAGRVIVAGRSAIPESGVRSMMRRLLVKTISQCDADVNAAGSAHVHPLVIDGDVVGILAAHPQDATADSTTDETQLLGAAAGNIAIYLSNVILYGDLNAMFLGTLEALTSAIDAKDRYTCGHSQRVAYLVEQLAVASGLDAATVARFHIAGLVHDIGKIGVPEHVLTKPGRLTEDEFRWIRRHPEIGERILRDIPHFQDIVEGVLHHHERWDGAGYPCGVAGESIPLVARMIGIADAFDAMTSTRTYRSALDRATVCQEIQRCAGSQFDPSLVMTFLSLDFRTYDSMVETHRTAAMRVVA